MFLEMFIRVRIIKISKIKCDENEKKEGKKIKKYHHIIKKEYS
jgi:hypothetical protein